MVDKKQIGKLYAAAKLSDTEQTVLGYVLNNIDAASESGIRSVASACYTSMTTVNRLSKKLGYQGYREMVFDLKHLQQASNSLSQHINDSDVHFTCPDGDIDLFVNAIHRKNVVGINGEGYSRIVAQYMMSKLVGLGIAVVNQDFLETDQFISSYRNRLNCMVLVSKSGQTEAILDTARACLNHGIITVGFTGNPESELAKTADVLFTVQDDHPMDLKNVKPNCFTGNCILAFEEILSLCIENLKQEGLTF